MYFFVLLFFVGETTLTWLVQSEEYWHVIPDIFGSISKSEKADRLCGTNDDFVSGNRVPGTTASALCVLRFVYFFSFFFSLTPLGFCCCCGIAVFIFSFLFSSLLFAFYTHDS